MAGPLFTVVVPTRDRAAFVAEAVRSVLNQTVRDLECIVVDDGSSAPVSLDDDPRVRVVRHLSPRGPAAARNTGLAAARGRYVAFLDDDDLYSAERLALGLEGLAQAPIAVCWKWLLGESPSSRHGRRYARHGNRRLDGDVHDVIAAGWVPSLGTVSIATELAPRFDERFAVGEDVDWWIRATRQTQVRTVPHVGYLVRVHSGPRPWATGVGPSVDVGRLLLDVHADYFAVRRRAAAYRWRILGGLCWRQGDRSAARRAFVRSFTLAPRAGTLAWWGRALLTRAR